MNKDIILSDISVALDEKVKEESQKNVDQDDGNGYINLSLSNTSVAGRYRVTNNKYTEKTTVSGCNTENSDVLCGCYSNKICQCCNIIHRHWKITIACLALLSLALFIAIIVLISILPRSTDTNTGQTTDICKYNVCLNNGSCLETENSFRCSCVTGYSGRLCELDHCTGIDCLNDGLCIRGENSTCKCRNGYSGNFCEVTSCTDQTCYHGGVCEVKGHSFVCKCPHGTSGERCENTVCSHVRCLNGGTCMYTSNISTCACTQKHYGEVCEHYCQYGADFYGCSFEEDENQLCFLTDDAKDDFNWTRNRGSTPTFNTGPSSSFSGDWYSYIEASPPAQQNQVARLISYIPLSTCIRCMQFKYHLFGVAIGTLNVYFGSTKIWTKSGNHGDMWQSASFEVNGNINKTLMFEAVRGEGITGDIALDDIQFSPGRCP